MRLWSLHPRYLDRMGLLALWREGLLAQKVLQGATKGYTRHPQLVRFQSASDPSLAIGSYLHHVCDEAESRGYNFDRGKIMRRRETVTLHITSGQVAYEWTHLMSKLSVRDVSTWRRHQSISVPDPHPVFRIVPGGIETWERVYSR